MSTLFCKFFPVFSNSFFSRIHVQAVVPTTPFVETGHAQTPELPSSAPCHPGADLAVCFRLRYILYIHYNALQRRPLFMILTVNHRQHPHHCGRLRPRRHSDSADGCTPTRPPPSTNTAIRLVNLLSLHGASPEQIEGGILGSVVPVLTRPGAGGLAASCARARILTVGPGLKSGIQPAAGQSCPTGCRTAVRCRCRSGRECRAAGGHFGRHGHLHDGGQRRSRSWWAA